MSNLFKVMLIALAAIAISLAIYFHQLGKTEIIGETILTATRYEGTIRISEKRNYSKYKHILDDFLRDYIKWTLQQKRAGVVLRAYIAKRTVRGRSVIFYVIIGGGNWADHLELKFRRTNGKWQLRNQKKLYTIIR